MQSNINQIKSFDDGLMMWSLRIKNIEINQPIPRTVELLSMIVIEIWESIERM